VLEPKPPPYSEEDRGRIVRAATCERMSTRAIRRTFGPCYQTLRRWVEKKGASAAALARDAAAGRKRRRARTR
jgi:transposase-like protein